MSHVDPKYIDAFKNLSSEEKGLFLLRVCLALGVEQRLYYATEAREQKCGKSANELFLAMISQSLGLLNKETVYPDEVFCHILFETGENSKFKELLDTWFSALSQLRDGIASS